MIVRIIPLHQGSTDIDHLLAAAPTSRGRLSVYLLMLDETFRYARTSIAPDSRCDFSAGMKVMSLSARAVIHGRAAVSKSWQRLQTMRQLQARDQINRSRAVMT
jgi:hypothetical protein